MNRYDVACAAGDTARVIEASLRCAVAARKAGGVSNIVFSDWKRDGAWWFRSSVDGSVYVTDQAERSVFRVLVCSTLLGGTFTCPDAAREAADAHLVSTGRLDKARAFVRLGEWGEDFASYYRTEGGNPCHHAYSAAQKAEVDAELVASGALDPSRAFKATTENTPNTMTRIPPERHNSVPPEVALAAKPAFPCVPIPANAPVTVSVHLHTGSIRVECEKAIPFVVHTARRGGEYDYSLSDGSGAWIAVKPGDHVRYTVTDGRGTFAHLWPRAGGHARLDLAITKSPDRGVTVDAATVARALTVAQQKPKPLAWDVGGGVTAVTGLAFGNAVPNTAVGIDYASAHGNTTTAVVVNKRADGVSEVVGYAQDITKMPDDEINAMYGKNSEVARAMIGAKRFAEQGRTTTVVSGDGKPLGTYYAITPDDIKRAEERIAAKQAVTLTNWERCLPMLLSDAPREFRDGFNRRQGPAWEAYLRALAWVKEQIQCRRVAPHTVATAVVLATGKAHGALGPEWVKANVR